VFVAGCVACAWVAGAPLVPDDAGRAGDAGSATRIFLALLVLAFLAYAAGLWLIGRRGAARRSVLVLAIVIQLVPLAGPLLLSTDAWTYWEYGRIAAVHDGNPYVDEPNEFPDDPAYDRAGAAWRGTTSVYGPGFSLLSEGVALSAGSSAAAAAWIFKTIAAVSVLACALLAARLARDRPFALAFVGWNPLLAIHFAGGGHNDALMMALVLASLVLGSVGRRGLAAVAWVASIFIKWVPVAFLVLRAYEARASGRRVSHVAFAAAAVALAAVSTLLYGVDWLRAFGPLARNAEGQTSYALPHRVEQLGVPHGVTLVLAGLVLAAGLVWLAREARRGRPYLGLAGCLLLATTPWLTAWYTIWALPLAAADGDRRAQLLALGFCAYLLPQTIPVL
jgi:hypothetical protein